METNAKKKVGKTLMSGTLITFPILVITLVVLTSCERPVSIGAYESAAFSSLRALYRANIAYAKDHPQQGFIRKLSDLSQRTDATEHGEAPEWMIDPVLGSGEKAGYRFTYNSQSTKGDGRLDAYQICADPLPGKPYRHHFFVDETGIFRTSDTGPANATSTILK